MKILLISAAVILALVGLITLFFSFKSKDIETPKYKLIKTIDGIEIRQYPKMLVAQTNMADSSMDKNMNSGFRTIAGYIFGGNERNQKIAMTAPVVFKMGDTASMYFVMPSKYKKEDLPNPNSTQVKIMEEREKVLAVITYSGFSSPKLVEKHQQKLMAVLQQNQIKTIGSYLYMGYNAPWDFVNRRNEVAIEVVL
ncbi:MAG: heme-binding protein [Bacteroidota bacterium]|nr:heme-binding protein [Bacteroidota bacterium]